MGMLLLLAGEGIAGGGMAVLRELLLAANQLGLEVGVAVRGMGMAGGLGLGAGEDTVGIARLGMLVGRARLLAAGGLGLGIAVLGMAVEGLLLQGAGEVAIVIVAIGLGMGMGIGLLLAAGEAVAIGGMGMLLQAAGIPLLLHGDGGQDEGVGGAEHHQGSKADHQIAPEGTLLPLLGKVAERMQVTHIENSLPTENFYFTGPKDENGQTR